MKTFLIILITIAYIGWKAYKGVRKNFTVDTDDTVNEPQADTPRPAFESLFDEEETNNTPYSFEEEEKAAGYYTYESTEEINPSTAQDLQPSPVSMVSEVEETQPEMPAFDLRQAVIYQTILNNKYNPEVSLS